MPGGPRCNGFAASVKLAHSICSLRHPLELREGIDPLSASCKTRAMQCRQRVPLAGRQGCCQLAPIVSIRALHAGRRQRAEHTSQLSSHAAFAHRQGVLARVYQAERTQQDEHGSATRQDQAAPTSGGPPFPTVTAMWPWLAQQHGDILALKEPHNAEAQDLTYRDAYLNMQQAAAGLQQLGLVPGDKVALIAESSSRWILADQAAMMAGAATAVRGSASPADEIAYIVGHAECSGLIVQDEKALMRLLPQLSKAVVPQLKYVVAMWGAISPAVQNLLQQVVQEAAAQAGHVGASPACPPLLSWTQLLEKGSAALAAQLWRSVQLQPENVATMVYTSGTSGHPKGVMLTHANLAYQTNNLGYFVDVQPNDAVLSILPPWHIYQRTCSYYIHSRAGRIVFTTIKQFRNDLTAYPPDHLVCVPLVLDTLYTRVMAKLNSASTVRRLIATTFLAISSVYVAAQRLVDGLALQHALSPPSAFTLFRAMLVVALLGPLHKLGTKLVYSKVREAVAVRRDIISGGGSLASHLDTFFEILGLPVVNGWGLTETSPVIACRRVAQNVRGTVGLPVPGTEVRVVDPESLAPLPAGQQGLVVARGPGIMRGYLRDDAATAKAFRVGEGWFDTGDLGWIVPEGNKMSGMVVLTGRAKDTIVLMNGKNIEPQPIEDAVCASPLIKHALLLGQDKRELGMVVFPDLDALEQHLADNKAAASGAAPAAPAAAKHGKQAEKSSTMSAELASKYPLVAAASAAELQALLVPTINQLNAARHDYTSEQHVGHVRVAKAVLSPEDGTLTRTMKLRRQEVCSKYAAEVNSLLSHLRGAH